MKVPFVDLKAQYENIKHEVDTEMLRVTRSQQFILGPVVRQFECEFADYIGTRYAVGVGSGLAALRLVLMAYDIGPGDAAIVPVNTFVATALAVTSVGARPIFVDCDETYNIGVQTDSVIIECVKAIIPVHLTGQPADMGSVMEMANYHNLIVIEDAAQAHGARYWGSRVGSLSAAGCFSFYPSKNLGCYGDGGIITTNSKNLADDLRRLRSYGADNKYHYTVLGDNSRLGAIQAAVLSVKLRHLDGWNERRARIAGQYRAGLDGCCGITFQDIVPDTTHVYHLMAVQAEERDELRAFLADRDIQTGVHYPIPLHLQPAYAYLDYKKDDFPVAERLAETTLSLPIYNELRDCQVEYVCKAIRRFYE